MKFSFKDHPSIWTVFADSSANESLTSCTPASHRALPPESYDGPTAEQPYSKKEISGSTKSVTRRVRSRREYTQT